MTLLNAPADDFPDHENNEDVPRKGEDYAEQWFAGEYDAYVAAVIWPEPMEQDPHGSAVFQVPRVRPQWSTTTTRRW